MPSIATHRSPSKECPNSQVQSFHPWPTHLHHLSLHVYPSSPTEVLVQIQTTPLFSQMRHPFHLHLRHRHTNMPQHTSPNLPLWHTINTSRLPCPGTHYLRRSTGWQTAFNNNFITRRCRSSKSSRPFPAMEPSEFFIVFINFTLFSLQITTARRLWRNKKARCHAPSFSAVTYRTGVPRIGVHGKGLFQFS